MDGSIGTPVVRRDAAAKATGAARYAADFHQAGTAYAALTTSTVARGRITRIDSAAAEAVPGVQMVLTHQGLNEPLDAATLAEDGFIMTGGHFQSSFNPLSSAEIMYAGQIVGLTVADTQEAAEEAARKLSVDYEAVEAHASIEDEGLEEKPSEKHSLDVGDAPAAFARAPAKVDQTYMTAPQHHNPIELYATTASWNDGKLTLYVPSQWVIGKRAGIAKVFGMAPEDVHIINPYIGGGFGSKASILWHTVLVAIAARRLGRPVKLVVPRSHMFTVGSFRPATRQHIALAAERDGTLQALIHEEWGQTGRTDDVVFPGVTVTPHMYACPNIRVRETMLVTDVNTPGFMRAPNETPSFFAFESAVDELAVALDMDPVALRLKNEPTRDPVKGVPYSSRSLVQCYERGMELFGWDRRTPAPGSMKDVNGALLGWGCATATYPCSKVPALARATIAMDGRLTVGAAAHDLGTGTYTILAQIAADALGTEVGQVQVQLGDSDLPSSTVAGGSVTAGNAGSAVQMACHAVREKLLALAAAGPFMGFGAGQLKVAGGRVLGPDGSSKSIAEVMDASATGIVEATAEWAPKDFASEQVRDSLKGGMAMAGPVTETHAMFSFGALFTEVRIDPLTRTVRVPRMVGVFAAGTILNPRTARSNLAGGMVWGVGHALMEATEIDRKRASFANTDLATYHVASCADVRDVTVEMLDETDTEVNALGAKAVGELGIVGMAAAIGNAVYHATGRRLRKLPMLVDDLL